MSKRSLDQLSWKEKQAQFAVKNRIAVWNSSPKQNRSVATQSWTAIAKKNASSIRSQEPNCSLEQQSQTESQCRYAESYKKKTVAVVFCIGAVTPPKLTLRQSQNRCMNSNKNAKFQCFGGCCNRCYIPHRRRLLNILYHVRMFPFPKNYITQPASNIAK